MQTSRTSKIFVANGHSGGPDNISTILDAIFLGFKLFEIFELESQIELLKKESTKILAVYLAIIPLKQYYNRQPKILFAYLICI